MQSHLSDLMKFIDDSPTPYHAVFEASQRLIDAGFYPLREDASFELSWNQGYFVISNGSLHAFRTPKSPYFSGFRLLTAHTDSPNLRLKPNAEFQKRDYYQIAVEVYGDPLINSWFDRDLSLAGRVFLKEPSGEITSELIRFSRPLFRIPQLAIHLDRELATKGLVINRQDHMSPIGGIRVPMELGMLKQLCATEITCDPEDILHMELMLYDTNPSAKAGLLGEFILSSRLDNLAMCHAALSALVAQPGSDQIPWVSLFDHEEVGSQTTEGAHSESIRRLLFRVLQALDVSKDNIPVCMAESACISMDMAHAIHPNYAEKHDPLHSPIINGGPVFKVNVSQRYASDGYLHSQVTSICDRLEIPYQWYSHRSDLPCGSTLGPIIAAQLGIKTIDIGNPMLSMHSIREMAGTDDHASIIKAVSAFLKEPSIAR